MKYYSIETLSELKKVFLENKNFNKIAFQNLDFNKVKKEFIEFTYIDCIFLGCSFSSEQKEHIENTNFIFPQLYVPYNLYPAKLYDKDSLYNKYEIGKPETYKNTYDRIVYEHFIATGKEANDIKESLARRLHDHSITDALYDFLENYDEKKVVAIMGGHSLLRTENMYLEIIKLSKKLTELGYLMISGGGPGAMEATHVGAWFADYQEKEVLEAYKILCTAPSYKSKNWLSTAFQVIEQFPRKTERESLGVPTWLYGHEPPTPFATKIAKYFANSVREDGLLTIAKGGIIFTPGSAGTMQEVFQEVTQNHYLIFGYASPMIFYDKKHWTKKQPVYSFLKNLQDNKVLKNLILSITDKQDEIITELERFD